MSRYEWDLLDGLKRHMAEHWGASLLASKSEFKFPASSIWLECRFQFTVALHLRIRFDQSRAVQRSYRCFCWEFIECDAHTYCFVHDRVALVCGVPLPDSGHEKHSAELFLALFNDFLDRNGSELKKTLHHL